MAVAYHIKSKNSLTVRAGLFCLAIAYCFGLSGNALHAKARPETRPNAQETWAANEQDFALWLAQFTPRAVAAGIDPIILNSAVYGIRLNQALFSDDQNQPEFTRPIWEYTDKAASFERIKAGNAKMKAHSAVLDRIEARYQVDREYVVAIWGLESNYGAYRGGNYIIEALANLAYEPRRSAFFEKQLIDALKIIQSGEIWPEKMQGSWAGAMGHTQFMPSSYLRYAQDSDGDGRRNIWSDDPSDALASTAHYLAAHGWQMGAPWGVEVTLPFGFDYNLAQPTVKRLPSEWKALGVAAHRPVDNDFGPSAIMLPAGANGPAFMVFKNYDVIRRYNSARSYVLGIGFLADQLAGKTPLTHGWPRHTIPLSKTDIKEMQSILVKSGFYTGKIDGLIGPMTAAALRLFQTQIGDLPDGFATQPLLEKLRAKYP